MLYCILLIEFVGGESKLEYKPVESVSYILKQLTGQKVASSKKEGGFQSKSGSQAIKCTHKSTDGYLYPLPKAFLFLVKPTIMIRFEEIDSISFQRDNFEGIGASQSFDIVITKTDKTEFEFKSIPRDECTGLRKFIQERKLNISNFTSKSDKPNYKTGIRAKSTTYCYLFSTMDVIHNIHNCMLMSLFIETCRLE